MSRPNPTRLQALPLTRRLRPFRALRRYGLPILVWLPIFLLLAEVWLRTYRPIQVVRTSKNKKEIEEYGFISRDLENFHYPPKGRGDRRILFLGDSFVYPGSFNTMFGKLANSGSRRFKYVTEALATGGWGTDQQYIAFKNKGLRHKPDVVILAFCQWNDLSNNLSIFHAKDQIKPYFVLRKGKLVRCRHDGTIIAKMFARRSRGLLAKLAMKAHDRLVSTSNLYLRTYYGLGPLLGLRHAPLFADRSRNIDGAGECGLQCDCLQPSTSTVYSQAMFTDRVTHYLQFVTSPRPIIRRGSDRLDISEYGYRLTMALLEEIDRSVRSYGGRFYLFLMPMANSYRWRRSKPPTARQCRQRDGRLVTLDLAYPSRKLTAMARKRGIPVIDITEAMERRYPDSVVLMRDPSDVHYNKKGNRFVAGELYRYFRRNIEPGLK